MKIETFKKQYQSQVINLILYIQNNEAKINLSIEEQPDLLNIDNYYRKDGGEFWIALENDNVIGTIAIMNKGNGNAVLKKFFVEKNFRNQKIGLKLYLQLLNYAKQNNIHKILLDTPSAATESHKFYEMSGFLKIKKSEIPFPYDFPDRDSILYLLNL